MSKVAVVSTDGVSINEHFGRSKEFLIYEVDEKGEYTFLERRDNISPNSQNVHAHIASTTADLLTDVEVVLAKQIGPGAEQELRKKGILALSVNSSIEKALQAYGKRGKFIKNSIKQSAGCQSSCGTGSCGGSSQGCK